MGTRGYSTLKMEQNQIIRHNGNEPFHHPHNDNIGDNTAIISGSDMNNSHNDSSSQHSDSSDENNSNVRSKKDKIASQDLLYNPNLDEEDEAWVYEHRRVTT